MNKGKSIRKAVRRVIYISVLVQLAAIWSLVAIHNTNAGYVAENLAVERSSQHVERMDNYIQQRMADAIDISWSSHLEEYYNGSHAKRFEKKDLTRKMLQELLLDYKTVGVSLSFDDQTSLSVGSPMSRGGKGWKCQGDFCFSTDPRQSEACRFLWSTPIWCTSGRPREIGELQLTFDIHQILTEYVGQSSLCQYQDVIVYQTEAENGENAADIWAMCDDVYGRLKIGSEPFIYVWQKSTALDADVLILYPQADLIENGSLYLKICVWLSVIAVAVVTFVLISLQHRICAPVNELCEKMQQARAIHGARITLERNAILECNQLSDRINEMLDAIENQMAQEKLEQERTMAMQQCYLQEKLFRMRAQINPHFLYNNLECIRGMARVGAWKEIGQMCTAMSRIYRYGTREGSSLVTLQEEIQCIREYETIIAMRYDDQYSFTISIPTDCETILVPRMILQPVCENVVLHGKKRPGSKITIAISAKMEDAVMCLQVEDNGGGMPQEKLEKLNEELAAAEKIILNETEGKVGLQNIGARLRILNGERSRIVLSNRKDGGLSVKIYIAPLTQQG